jgi:hypothetical protein
VRTNTIRDDYSLTSSAGSTPESPGGLWRRDAEVLANPAGRVAVDLPVAEDRGGGPILQLCQIECLTPSRLTEPPVERSPLPISARSGYAGTGAATGEARVNAPNER